MLKNNCPVCDSEVTLPEGTEVSEIVSCADCHTRLVVSALVNGAPTLVEAPKVEEDWGE
jgi:alpha-aminoadipate carrier protein LysW